MRRADGRYELDTLALLPSWECDVACHHCVFHSSPKLKGRLPLSVAVDAVSQIARTTTARRVTISGGEAFLDFDYLVSLAEAIRNAGLALRVVTNGSFADDFEIAKAKISRLQGIGIESVALSWDAFHEQFVKVDCIRNTIRACRATGVSVRLTMVVSEGSRLAHILESLGDDGFEIPITQVKCLPVGRAEKKLDPDQFLATAAQNIGKSCRSDFDTLSLTPNGDVFPCCAVGGFTDGIKLGRFPDDSIDKLLTRRGRELIWVALASQGPTYFLNRMTIEQRQSLGLGCETVHDCVACNRLFRTSDGTVAVREVIDRLRATALDVWTHGQFNG